MDNKKPPLTDQLRFVSINSDGKKSNWNQTAGQIMDAYYDKGPSYVPAMDDKIIDAAANGLPFKASTFRDIFLRYGMDEPDED